MITPSLFVHFSEGVLPNISGKLSGERSLGIAQQLNATFKVAHNSLVRIRHAHFRCSITATPIIFRKIF